ncbi:MAG: hypothetical protein ACRC33_13020 [Gemmataceae bacterium]
MRWLSLLLLAPAGAFGQEPRAVIARAIDAHGGHHRLAEARADRVRLRGYYFLGTGSVGFTNEMTLQLPEQFKSVVTMTDPPHVIVHALDGVHASTTIDGKPAAVNPATLAQLRQTIALDQAMRLVPLLTDKAVTLTALGEFTVEGRAAHGVGVRRGGQRELKLYFDKVSALMLASEHQLDGPDGRPVVQQARYAGHRDAGGHVRPGTVTVFRDGKKVMQAELVEARRVERIDPAEFRTP